MSEWRPGDWENPYGEVAVADDFDKEPTMLLSLRPVFEAGADAILAALREQDIREFETLVGGVDGRPSGTLVFIPDKE